jgi:hypothetical protein
MLKIIYKLKNFLLQTKRKSYELYQVWKEPDSKSRIFSFKGNNQDQRAVLHVNNIVM